MARKSKAEMRALKSESNQRRYSDIKSMAKRANQRLRAMEKEGIKSPAYESAQATLEMMGKSKTGKDTGRRFSEKTTYTYREAEQMRKVLKKFLESKTSTKSGYNEVLDSTWESADQGGKLSSKGVSKEEYFDIFKNLPAKHKDRFLSSDDYMAIVEAVQKKQNEMKLENKMTTAEIIQAINEKKNVEDAYEAVGLTFEEFANSPFFGE